MKSKIIRPFSNLKFENWKNLLFFAIICFYFIVLFPLSVNSVGGDYLAFWSAGKIADIKGYSKIYDLSELRIVQRQIIIDSGDRAEMDDPSFSPIPVPY